MLACNQSESLGNPSSKPRRVRRSRMLTCSQSESLWLSEQQTEKGKEI
jgi:hypothetical protein